MKKLLNGTGFTQQDAKGDTFRASRKDDLRGNLRVAFAVFADEYLREHSLATRQEALDAFNAERGVRS